MLKEIDQFKPDNVTKNSTLIIITISMVFYSLFVSKLSVKSIFIEFDLSFFISILLAATFFIQHELIHLIVAKILGYGDDSKLSIFSISIDGFIRRKDLILILISPAIIVTTFYVILAFIYDRFALLFLCAAAINFIGSKRDISMTINALKYDKQMYFKGEEDSEIITVYKKDK